MNFLLFAVPPLHSPVLEPDFHLKRQRNLFFWLHKVFFTFVSTGNELSLTLEHPIIIEIVNLLILPCLNVVT